MSTGVVAASRNSCTLSSPAARGVSDASARNTPDSGKRRIVGASSALLPSLLAGVSAEKSVYVISVTLRSAHCSARSNGRLPGTARLSAKLRNAALSSSVGGVAAMPATSTAKRRVRCCCSRAGEHRTPPLGSNCLTLGNSCAIKGMRLSNVTDARADGKSTPHVCQPWRKLVATASSDGIRAKKRAVSVQCGVSGVEQTTHSSHALCPRHTKARRRQTRRDRPCVATGARNLSVSMRCVPVCKLQSSHSLYLSAVGTRSQSVAAQQQHRIAERLFDHLIGQMRKNTCRVTISVRNKQCSTRLD